MDKTVKLLFGSILFFIVLSTTTTVMAAPILKLHSQGHDVRLLQQMLQKQNYGVRISGIFDISTQEFVKQFQKDNHLAITGATDRQTWDLLENPTIISSPAITLPPSSSRVSTPAIKTPLPIRHQSPSIGIKPTSSQNNDNIAEIRAITPKESAPFLPAKKADDIISTAKKYIGTPYVYGGESPKGFDCSGYLQYVFKKNNVNLPRTADKQYELGKKVPVKKLQPGDLVFFATDAKEISHCGIYLGQDEFIHSSSSRGVRIDKLDNVYWQKYFVSGKHIIR